MYGIPVKRFHIHSLFERIQRKNKWGGKGEQNKTYAPSALSISWGKILKNRQSNGFALPCNTFPENGWMYCSCQPDPACQWFLKWLPTPLISQLAETIISWTSFSKNEQAKKVYRCTVLWLYRNYLKTHPFQKQSWAFFWIFLQRVNGGIAFIEMFRFTTWVIMFISQVPGSGWLGVFIADTK